MSFHNGIWSDPDQAELERIKESILNPSEPAAPTVSIDKTQEFVSNAIAYTTESVKEFLNTKVYEQTKKLNNLFGKKVDVIIPVYNAIHLTEQCIRALYARTTWPFDLIVIDDGSTSETNRLLKELQKEFNFTLLVNEKNHGFSASVNRGVKFSSNPYIVLLNSDVLVTDGWLTKMLLAMEDNPKNQIVNPATNNTAQININMYPGYSYIAMNKAFEIYSERRYPEIMPTGFCYLIKRDLFKELGYFSPHFTNFGEESHSWMRTVTHTKENIYPHYRAVLADDTYVFHQRSVSFSGFGDEETMKLRSKAADKFHKLCPNYSKVAAAVDCKRELEVLRNPLSNEHLNYLIKAKYKICWLVHSVELCGGMMYIADIVNEINERGGDARIALVKRVKDMNVAPIAELRTAPVVFESYADVIESFHSKVFDKGIVVASTVELAPVVNKLIEKYTSISPLLHVQSYEPDLVDDPALKKQVEENFSLIPNVISSSGWVTKELESKGINIIDTVVPGIDPRIFYPRGRATGADERPTVMLCVKKNYAFKGYERAVQLIKYMNFIADRNKLEIRILVYGVDMMPEATEAICLGQLSQVRLAEYLSKEVDVFIDPAYVHSYGLPALEALASGCAVVSWDNKGINEYIEHGKNGLIFKNKTAPDKVALEIVKLLADSSLKKPLIQTSGKIRKEHNRQTSVAKFIDSVEQHFGISKPRKIFVVSPHFRKHGGPTTILDLANGLKEAGHDVRLGCCYTDIEFDVVKMTDIPITMFDLADLRLPQQAAEVEARIPECDVIISNSDNPLNSYFAESKKASKKIMLKLSHNPRFKPAEEAGMLQPWDAILTSSDWLKETCLQTTKGWNYAPFPEEKVFKIGWSHYAHKTMNFAPNNRTFPTPEERPIVIATLIHQHPSKGTMDALKVFDALHRLLGDKVVFYGIGEIPPKQLQIMLANFHYNPRPDRRRDNGEPLTRTEMAYVLQHSDIWFGASHSEGLGRMALEAMSASAACVISDTGAAYAENGKNCFTAPVGDLKEMARLITLLVSNPELRRQFSNNGYRTACEAAGKRIDLIRNVEKAISFSFKDK